VPGGSPAVCGQSWRRAIFGRPLPQAVYDMAERRKLSRAWDAAFEGTEYVGMLDAEAANGNGAH
jgi:hypothetical protein